MWKFGEHSLPMDPADQVDGTELPPPSPSGPGVPSLTAGRGPLPCHCSPVSAAEPAETVRATGSGRRRLPGDANTSESLPVRLGPLSSFSSQAAVNEPGLGMLSWWTQSTVRDDRADPERPTD